MSGLLRDTPARLDANTDVLEIDLIQIPWLFASTISDRHNVECTAAALDGLAAMSVNAQPQD